MIGNVKIKNRLMMAPMDTGFGNNAWGGFTPEGVEYFARRAEGGFGLLFSGGTSADCKVDKKTFYHYYETLDFLLAEMQAELSAGFLERVKDYALPDDLDKVSRAFFLYAAEQGLAYKKITCGGSYHAVRDEMTDKVTDAAWSKSKKYHQLNDYEKKVLMGFINNAVLNAYREWVQDGKEIPMDKVIEITNKLVLGGVKGFFK